MDADWTMHGIPEGSENYISDCQELIEYVNKVGFLPLFGSEIRGFSVEEHTSSAWWWTGNREHDPWEWRVQAARSGKVAYGKFFGKRAGFISLEWLPVFANWRRDGYDFDSRWEDQKASIRSKKIMDLFADGEEMFSFEAKRKAGFGREGEKNFEGTVTDLEMMMYLVIRDFRRRVKKNGEEYGWEIGILTAPETVWGYDLMSSHYTESPETSMNRILEKMKETYPGISDEIILKNIK